VDSDAATVDSDAAKVDSDAVEVDSDAAKVDSDAAKVDSDAAKVDSDAAKVDLDAVRVRQKRGLSPNHFDGVEITPPSNAWENHRKGADVRRRAATHQRAAEVGGGRLGDCFAGDFETCCARRGGDALRTESGFAARL
jgi:hypothetical protein